jgi:ATPase subunit of ABC transporter with duplicated ATPase domains
MNGRQFIYHMEGLTKTYPAGKKVLENIHLSFYPDAKIGVQGVNGASRRCRTAAGIDTDFNGEAIAEGRASATWSRSRSSIRPSPCART